MGEGGWKGGGGRVEGWEGGKDTNRKTRYHTQVCLYIYDVPPTSRLIGSISLLLRAHHTWQSQTEAAS